MTLALVTEPIRLPNGEGHKTVEPKYVIRDGQKMKICPQVNMDKRHYQLFLEAGHVLPAISDADSVEFTGNGKQWTPTVHVAEPDGDDDGANGKAGKADKTRAANPKGAKQK